MSQWYLTPNASAPSIPRGMATRLLTVIYMTYVFLTVINPPLSVSAQRARHVRTLASAVQVSYWRRIYSHQYLGGSHEEKTPSIAKSIYTLDCGTFPRVCI